MPSELTRADLIGQLVLIPLIDCYGYGHAMKMNSLGIFMASVYSLISSTDLISV